MFDSRKKPTKATDNKHCAGNGEKPVWAGREKILRARRLHRRSAQMNIGWRGGEGGN